MINKALAAMRILHEIPERYLDEMIFLFIKKANIAGQELVFTMYEFEYDSHVCCTIEAYDSKRIYFVTDSKCKGSYYLSELSSLQKIYILMQFMEQI